MKLWSRGRRLLSTCCSLRASRHADVDPPVDARIIKTGFDPRTCSSNFRISNMLARGDLTGARQVFDGMRNKNTVSINVMISGYAKAGDLASARALFDSMDERTAVTWTIMIGGYSHHDRADEAFELFTEMLRSGMGPDYVTFATLLSGFNSAGAACHLVQVHGLVVKLGFGSVQIVGNSLLDTYCKVGHVDLARQLFKEMPGRDAVSFNALITGYSNEGLFKEAIRLFMKLLKSGCRPSEFTFASVLAAGSGLGELAFGQHIHGIVIKMNFLQNVFLGNALLDFYSKHDQIRDARKLFEEMPEIDDVSYNILIAGYAWVGEVRACKEIFRGLQSTRYGGRHFPFAPLLSLAANTCDLEMGRQIHSQTIVTTADSELQVENALIDMYAKCGKFNEAEILFTNLPYKNSVPWTALISAYVQNGLHEEALKLFVKMNRDDVGPDQATFASVLKACASLASALLGNQLHSCLVKSGFLSNVYAGSALLDVYAKCGLMKEAIKTFDQMPTRNIISWNAMLTAYAHGDGKATISAFEEMVQLGYVPDSISFLNVLSACSHSGLVEEGLKYFDMMNRDYKHIVKREHYACALDVLFRAGRFDEAEELMSQMPYDPDEITWVLVLNSCRIYKNEKLALKAEAALFKMEGLRDAGPHVNLSNIYAAAGRWDDVARVKKAQRERGIKKILACSWVEVKHRTHVFAANDNNHPEIWQIRRKLDELGEKMEQEGYKPDPSCTLHNVDEEIRIASLKYHSERLAIAYALISTPEGSPIVVVKNLRTCTDCHAAIKVMSKVVAREITVRDTSRFHHFSHGVCSCMDYW
ncbi:putative pentatricopeptide repeat-containing protein At2g01510 [Punica granatum]|uniref:Pentatricopeptide repeat-containing protein At2g01510 n=2 Tax=Punica granatum TaxID=22663 RepID=A0A6P8CC85_PUNGR|nr:putative pentatricopeptide repeat-containing protein At2g01510 [Punica granatum]